MRTDRRAHFASLLLFVCLAGGIAQGQVREITEVKPETVGFSSERLEKLDKAMQATVANKTLSGAVTVLARHGKIVQTKTYGQQDIAAATPMQKDSIFRIFSMTKPTIGAWGLNFQHCAHVTFFPSHSFEQFYQGVRRCWRFGQTRPVLVDIVTTEGERGVLANLTRKATAADLMFSQLVAMMRQAQSIAIGDSFPVKEEVPVWLS